MGGQAVSCGGGGNARLQGVRSEEGLVVVTGAGKDEKMCPG